MSIDKLDRNGDSCNPQETQKEKREAEITNNQ